MNGMHCDTFFAYNFDQSLFSWSFTFQLPPTPTIAQLTLCQIFEFQDQTAVDVGFTHDEFIDSNGVLRHNDWDPNNDALPKVLVVSGLTRIDGVVSVWGCQGQTILNTFFWDHVF